MVCMYCAGQGRLFEVEELVGGDAGWRTRAYLDQPKPTGVKLGRPWPNTSQLVLHLGATCAELGPLGSNLGPTMTNVAQLGGTRPSMNVKTHVSACRPSCPLQTWAQVVLCWTQVEAKLMLAEVGPKWIQTLSWSHVDAHGGPGHVQHGPTWDPLVTASYNLGPTETQHREHCCQREASSMPKKRGTRPWKRFFWRFRIGPFGLGWSCPQLGAKLHHVGSALESLRSINSVLSIRFNK